MDMHDFHEQHPEIFQLPELPPYWTFNKTVDVSMFIDAYMHILFLGYMKAIATIIKSYMKDKHKTQYFLHLLNVKITDIKNHNSLNLLLNKG